MLLSRCFKNNFIRQLSTARRLYSSEPHIVDVLQPQSAPKPCKKRPKKADKDVLKDRKTASSLRQHHDLLSFNTYASKVSLDPKSTVYVGTYYEYVVQSSLSRLSFKLQHSGGANDCGIDLLGTWKLPIKSHPISLKVLVQCKALASRGGPNLVRELEGAFNGAPHAFKGHGVLGLLVTQKPATKGMRDALGRSNWPMGCVTITNEGRVIQMLWNRRAEEEGLEGVDVGIKYANDGEQDVVLLWRGESITMAK